MRFQALDSLRGIFALMVVAYHLGHGTHFGELGLVQGGFLFVDFFFVLSGFVMAFAYHGRIQNSKDFREFAIRRLGRIWPLHAFMLVMYLALTLFKLLVNHSFPSMKLTLQSQDTVLSFFANLFLVHSMGLFSNLTWNFPSWSISAEVWCYLIFGVLTLFCSLRWIGLVSLLLSGIGAIILIHNSSTFMDATYDWGLLRCVYGFFLGVLTQAIWRRWQRHHLSSASVWEFFVLLGVVAFVSHCHADNSSFAAPLVFSLAVFVFAHGRGRISRVLTSKPLAQLGIWSYSIYMIHAWILIVANMVVNAGHALLAKLAPAVMVSIDEWSQSVYVQDVFYILLSLFIIFCSSITYRFIESPGRDFAYVLAKRLRAKSDPGAKREPN